MIWVRYNFAKTMACHDAIERFSSSIGTLHIMSSIACLGEEVLVSLNSMICKSNVIPLTPFIKISGSKHCSEVDGSSLPCHVLAVAVRAAFRLHVSFRLNHTKNPVIYSTLLLRIGFVERNSTVEQNFTHLWGSAGH